MKPKTMTPTPPDKDELSKVLDDFFDETPVDGKAPQRYIKDLEQAINRLIAKERLDELKLATVGRVTNRKNAASLTYMSGFGYAANNLQEHKNTRLTALQAQAEKEEQG